MRRGSRITPRSGAPRNHGNRTRISTLLSSAITAALVFGATSTAAQASPVPNPEPFLTDTQAGGEIPLFTANPEETPRNFAPTPSAPGVLEYTVPNLLSNPELNPTDTSQDTSSGLQPDEVLNKKLDEQNTREIQRKLQNDYIKWETEKATKAADALALRLKLRKTTSEGGNVAQIIQNRKTENALVQKDISAATKESQKAHDLKVAAVPNQLANQPYKPTSTPTPAPAKKYAWSTYVANVDAQAAVDTCAGGLTYSPSVSKVLGQKYYPIHNRCNGLPILSLKNGDLVHIAELGDYRVVDSRNVKQGDTTAALKGLKGDSVLQTCYQSGDTMRVVGIQKV